MFRSLLLIALLASACTSAASDPAPPIAPAPERAPETRRVVALGDLHGDLEAARAALRLAGVLDAKDAWAGGDTIVVQTGDLLDRGDQDIALLELFTRLRDEAGAVGGDVVALNGNHEVMNVDGDVRYVTDGAFEDARQRFSQLDDREDPAAARIAAFAPGGPLAKMLAQRDTIAVVGDSVFVHGGLRPEHVRYGIARLNEETRAWMRGDGERPAALGERDGPIWYRGYSNPAPNASECSSLNESLELLGVQRMVVGHTVQERINDACGGGVWRIDVGMAHHYRGPIQVLEVANGAVTPLTGDRESLLAPP